VSGPNKDFTTANGKGPKKVYCWQEDRDGGGWTLGIKSWYGAHNYYSGNGLRQTNTIDSGVMDHLGQYYKMDDEEIRVYLGQPDPLNDDKAAGNSEMEIMRDQSGHNKVYSDYNREYTIMKYYTGRWYFDTKDWDAMPESTTDAELSSYAMPGNYTGGAESAGEGTLNWRGRPICGKKRKAGIGCVGSHSGSPQTSPAGGAGCNQDLGRDGWSGDLTWTMCESNHDTYTYMCSGAQHSSSNRFASRVWFRSPDSYIPDNTATTSTITTATATIPTTGQCSNSSGWLHHHPHYIPEYGFAESNFLVFCTSETTVCLAGDMIAETVGHFLNLHAGWAPATKVAVVNAATDQAGWTNTVEIHATPNRWVVMPGDQTIAGSRIHVNANWDLPEGSRTCQVPILPVRLMVSNAHDYTSALLLPEFPFTNTTSVDITWEDISTEELEKLVGGIVFVEKDVTINGCKAATRLGMGALESVGGSFSLTNSILDEVKMNSLTFVGGTFVLAEATVKQLQLDVLEECGAIKIGNNVGGLVTFSLPRLKYAQSITVGEGAPALEHILLPMLESTLVLLHIIRCNNLAAIDIPKVKVITKMDMHHVNKLGTVHAPMLEHVGTWILYGAYGALQSLCGAPNLKATTTFDFRWNNGRGETHPEEIDDLRYAPQTVLTQLTSKLNKTVQPCTSLPCTSDKECGGTGCMDTCLPLHASLTNNTSTTWTTATTATTTTATTSTETVPLCNGQPDPFICHANIDDPSLDCYKIYKEQLMSDWCPVRCTSCTSSSTQTTSTTSGTKTTTTTTNSSKDVLLATDAEVDNTESIATDSGYSAVVVVGVVLLVVIVIFAIILVVRRKGSVQLNNGAFETAETIHNAAFSETMLNTSSSGNIREIQREHLRKIATVGAGQFGEVWKAYLDESTAGGAPSYLVAAKTVASKNASAAASQELHDEANVMAGLASHPNVLAVIGVITVGYPLVLVMSYCEHGSLLSYLEANAAKGEAIDLQVKIRLGRDVARGMEHLASRHFIHRDLAARNVLVSSELVGIIADFGLSRGSNASSYVDVEALEVGGGQELEYYRSRNGMAPVRWTSPEALQTSRFSTASDVWSFGIVLV
jgi:hypothetical protein